MDLKCRIIAGDTPAEFVKEFISGKNPGFDASKHSDEGIGRRLRIVVHEAEVLSSHPAEQSSETTSTVLARGINNYDQFRVSVKSFWPVTLPTQVS